jgi:predicted metal-dependent phosphoesterase TrpH
VTRSGAEDPPLAWKRADLHLHTSFSGWRSLHLIDPQDCYVAPEVAFRAARARGMDFVCFTDHNTIEGALDFLSRHPEEEPRVIVGEEVEVVFPGTRQWLHVNVYGVDEALHDDLQRLRGNCFELVDHLAARGAFFVLNHPFQSFRSVRAARRDLGLVLSRFPGIEVQNSTSPRGHERILRTLALHAGPGPRALVGGSDAHTLPRIACAYTTAPGATKHEFLDHVRRGGGLPGGRALGTGALIRDVYLVVAEYYRRLYGPDYPLSAGRRLRNVFWSSLLFPGVLLGVPALLPALHAARQEWIARLGRWERTGALAPRPGRLDAPVSLR